jgi:hypothetical protein
MDGDDWAVVYRGFSVPALDIVQAMLQAEGLEPRRLGKASPAMLGAGNFAVEQLIEVPREHEQVALALIADALRGSTDAARSEELETQALSAPPASASPAVAGQGGFSARVIAVIVVVAVVLYLLLR